MAEKKRYHQSMRDRIDESAGDMWREKSDKFNDEFRKDSEPMRGGKSMNLRDSYSGMDSRYRREIEDGGMIHEDHRAIANLPQEVRITPYPKGRNYLPEDLDDTIGGVDRQMDYDNDRKMDHFYPKKV